LFRSLFGKIFLWFCTTVVVGSLATIFLAYLFNVPGGPGDLGPISRLNDMTAFGMARTYEDHGPEALTKFIHTFQQDTQCVARLFDESGRELAGLDVDDHILKAVEAHMAAAPPPPPPKEEMEHPWLRPPGPPPWLDRMKHGQIMQSLRFRTPSKHSYLAVIRFPSPFHFLKILLTEGPHYRIVIFILAGFFLSYLLASYLTKPVRHLQIAARRLGRGDLSVRVNNAKDMHYKEFKELGDDFNRMAERVEKLVRSQQQLIRDISHELRSPLTRMKLSLELARKRSDPVCQNELDRIDLDTARLEDLLGQALTFAQMDKLEDDLETELLNLGALLVSVARDADIEAQVKNVTLSVDVQTVVLMQANLELMRRTLENILRNAVRYSPKGKVVEATLRTDDDNGDILVEVRDYGPGVPEEHLTELFKPFFRSDPSRDRGTGGTGLGLAIASRAVKMHGGSIIAANADGGGLLVQVRLPWSNVQED